MVTVRKIILEITCILRLVDRIPHMEKHRCEIPDTFSLQHHACIFPVSETFPLVDIFVSQIDAPCEPGMSVNHTDFSVIPVIHDDIQKWPKRIKDLAFNSFCLKLLVVFMGKRGQTPKIIINQPDIHSFFYFFLQNIQN